MPLSEEEKRQRKLKRQKIYREQNKELLYKKKKEYNKTEAGKKSSRILNWKKYGIICIDYDEMYNIYINTSKCDYCNKEFKNSLDRHLDHNHETGEVRGILCRGCNIRDVLKDS